MHDETQVKLAADLSKNNKLFFKGNKQISKKVLKCQKELVGCQKELLIKWPKNW